MSRLSIPEVAIRRAEARDAAAMAKVMSGERAYSGTLQLPMPSVDDWERRLQRRDNGDVILVAEVGDEMVGHLGLHAVSQSPRRRHAMALGMTVSDRWQGRGVGSALLGKAIELADRWLNLMRLELSVYVDNTPALALYRKFGFEIEGTARAFAFRDGAWVDSHHMARLNPACAGMINGTTTIKTKTET